MSFDIIKRWLLILPLIAVSLYLSTTEGIGSFDESGSTTTEVNVDSLRNLVRFLSVDQVTSTLRTRFTFREEPLLLVADSLASRLERYIGVSPAFLPFQLEGGAYAPDSTFTTNNIAVRLQGDGSVEGAFYVTAHYDAIATHDAEWMDNWTSHPAPGADDNASGVAALVEIARTLADHETPFDIVFVLFSAEELGLLGSEDYVERMTQGEIDEVIGLFNLDMIGYVDGGADPGVLVVSNVSSGWLADLAMESFDRSDPMLDKVLLKPGLAAYDHKSFWDAGMNGISFSEPFSEDGRVLYPYYHSTSDTIGHVDFEQVERITAAVANLIMDLAEAPAEVSLIPSDLIFYRLGGVTSRRTFNVGDTLTVSIRPRNLGAGNPPEGSMIRLDVNLENRHGTELLHSESFPAPPPYRAVVLDLPILLSRRHVGENVIRAEIEVSGMNDDPDDNEVLESFAVMGGEEILLDHHFQPNPIRSGFGEAIFCVNLAAQANLKIEIFNLEGESLGRTFLGNRVGIPLDAGFNCFTCGDILPDIGQLASGIYPYRIVLYGEDDSTSNFSGRFAVEK